SVVSLYFFFSSRRRHTRFDCDWSSDVCSSDLVNPATLDPKAVAEYAGQAKAQSVTDFLIHIIPTTVFDAFAKGDILQVLLVSLRSEERRVGKECRSRW